MTSHKLPSNNPQSSYENGGADAPAVSSTVKLPTAFLQPIQQKNHAQGMHGKSALTEALSPELQRVVQNWPTLPEHIRAAILALVGTVKP